MSDARAPWDSLQARGFAARLSQRHPGAVGAVGEELRDHPSEGEALLRFVERLQPGQAPGRSVERYEWEVLDRSEGIPWKVRSGMNDCQKPFQLWNVEREELSYPYELERGPEYRVGRGAELPAELRVPRRIEKSTPALKAWIEEQEFQQVIAKGNKRNLRRLLSQPLPFGKDDDAAPESDPSTVRSPFEGLF